LSNISTKRKFVANGVFQAELNEMLKRELGEDGYAGLQVRATSKGTQVIVKATQTHKVMGERNVRIKELSSLVQRRHNFPDGNLELFAERVANRGLCATAQCESLKYRLEEGMAVRRAAYSILRVVMKSGAKGCEIIVTGKLRASRAQAMKFADGYMIKTGDAVNQYLDKAVTHLNMKQGVLGIKVIIMLPRDPEGKQGPTQALPDEVIIHDPKVEYTVQDVYAENMQADDSKQQQAPAAQKAQSPERQNWGEVAAPVPIVDAQPQPEAQQEGGWGADQWGNDGGWGAN
jgi:small subunit ribosomal protein S3e